MNRLQESYKLLLSLQIVFHSVGKWLSLDSPKWNLSERSGIDNSVSTTANDVQAVL